MGRLAILAGQGDLPQILAKADPEALFVHFEGVGVDLPPQSDALLASYERLGDLFGALRAAGVTDLVFAGGLARPRLDPARFDERMRALAPSLMAAMRGGDDGLLRAVIAVFETEGFAVRGAHELVEGLTAAPGLLVGPEPTEADRQDASRARAILSALGPLDVGQGAVVAGGQALGVETVQGTDAMLAFVARTPAHLRQGARGVLVKSPKPGQDLRVDMPAIGPGTVAAASAAGLAGIVIDARQVLLVGRTETLRAADEAGLFVLSETPP